jgi:hypothetical protein
LSMLRYTHTDSFLSKALPPFAMNGAARLATGRTVS